MPEDQPVRMPPPHLPRIEPLVTLRGLTHGYANGHVPDDPLTGKIYFDWPMQFVAIDSYPAPEAAAETADWAHVAAFWTARAEADAAFMKEYGKAHEGMDIYHDRSRDRMRDRVFAAVNAIRPDPCTLPDSTRRHWREIDTMMSRSFPPTAAFASVIAGAVDEYLLNTMEREREMRRLRARAVAQPTTDTGLLSAQLSGRIGALFGLRAAPTAPATSADSDPDHFEDFQMVRHEAAEWLRLTRTLASDHPLDAATRERFLAWLDDLHDRNCAVFGSAMFRLAQLSAADASIRARFPDALYDTYARAGMGGSCWHQMLGYFPSAQTPKPIDDPRVPLLMLSHDDAPDFRVGDVGEMQFFIRQRDLRARNFASVELEMQGH